MSSTNQKDFKAERQLQDANLKKSWYKQAFLMNYMYPLVHPLKRNMNPSKFIKLVSTKDNNIINRLTMSPDIMTFLEGTPVEYAQLVPQIEVYKIYIKDKKRAAEVLLPFASYTNFQEDWNPGELLKAPFRGRDAGIESVSMKMDGIGKNPFAAQMMRVTIKFIFNDVKTLFKSWDTTIKGKPYPVQYADLIRHSGNVTGSDSKAESYPAAFQIKLSIGWSTHEDNPILTETKQGKLFASAANNSRMNFIGTLSKHDMEFLENGSVRITGHYEGALEAAMSSIGSDIMSGYNVDDINIRTLKAQLHKLEATGNWDAEKQTFGANKKQYSDLKKQEKALLQLEATRAKIMDLVRAAKGDNAFVDVRKELSKDYEAYRKTMGKHKGVTEFLDQQLQDIASGMSLTHMDALSGGHEDMMMAAEGIRIRKQIESSQKYSADLKIARNQIIKGIEALETNMRAQNLFAHIQNLMENDQVGWINTHGNKAFESYTEYLDALENAAKAKKEGDETLADIETADAKEKALEAQSAANGMQPAATGNIDVNDATSNMMGKLQPLRVTEVFCDIEGTQHAIETFKKVGSEAKLFSADDDTKGEKLMFFMLGDLISTIFNYGKFGENIEHQIPDFRIILGNIDYSPPMANSATIASLYFLPISLEVFTKFLANKIVKEGKKSYPLIKFIRDLVTFIVQKIAAPGGQAAEGNAMINPTSNKKFKLNLTPLSLPKKFLESTVKGGVHLNPILDLSSKNQKSYNAATRLPINKLSNVFLLTPYTQDPYRARASMKSDNKNSMLADPILDKEEGIPHFVVGGPNRGILKSIKFVEQTDQLFAMSLMRDQFKDETVSGRGIIQPKMFKCEAKLVGNPYFYVGAMFYVNTALISGNMFEKENILNGGYYLITSVETSISNSKWETQIGGILTLSDLAIRKSKKAEDPSDKKGAEKLADVPPAKQAAIKGKQKDAEQQTSDAISNTPQSQPPSNPCAPKGERC